MENTNAVVIVGAGPAGLATAACLQTQSIPSIIIEKESCSASLWKCRAYDRLKLHLAKEFCELPYMSYPNGTPTFVPKDKFIKYLDDYVQHFNLSPIYSTTVESASFNESSRTWTVVARNVINNEVVHEHTARVLVVATGENSEGVIPNVPGLSSFTGEIVHSSNYKSGAEFTGKNVLVVGSGNSGMEIAYDLVNHGANTSITIRSPMHVMTKEMIHIGMVLLKSSSLDIVDDLLVTVAKLKYGDLNNYGIISPSKGPFYIKSTTGRSAVIDVGTIEKIQSGEIQVLKGVSQIEDNQVKFQDGKVQQFHAIVFATGYKSTVNKWLKDGDFLFNEDGMPKEKFPNHWKGKNGLYCAGFARRGLDGISKDARNIAKHIKNEINN